MTPSGVVVAAVLADESAGSNQRLGSASAGVETAAAAAAPMPVKRLRRENFAAMATPLFRILGHANSTTPAHQGGKVFCRAALLALPNPLQHGKQMMRFVQQEEFDPLQQGQRTKARVHPDAGKLLGRQILQLRNNLRAAGAQ